MFVGKIGFGVILLSLFHISYAREVGVEEAEEYKEIYIADDQIAAVAKQMLEDHEEEIDQGKVFIEPVSKEINSSGTEVCTVIKAAEKRFISWSDGEKVAGRSYGFMNPYINVAFLIQNHNCK